MPFFITGCGTGAGGGGGGAANLSGTIYDIEFTPISNANVNSGTTTIQSLSNGVYKFNAISAGIKKINITATGFTPSYRQITVSGGQTVNAGPSFLSRLDGKITPVGISGGTAANTNGSIKMSFPAGVLSATKDIVLTAVPMVAAPILAPSGQQFVSFIVYAKPEGITFSGSGSAELTIPNLTSITAEAVDFYSFDTVNFVWTFLATGENKVPSNPSNPITVFTPSMGWIAAIMKIKPGPGIIAGTVTNSSTHNIIAGANVWTNTANTVTDNFGQYVLTNIPPGSAKVFASALGYIAITEPGLSVTVSQAPPDTPKDFTLDPQTQSDITGIIRQDDHITQIAGAKIVESARGEIAYSDAFGRYTLYNLPPGPTDLSVFASGYISTTETVTVPYAQDKNFFLKSSGALHTYSFDFESGGIGTTENFGTTGFWHLQDSSEAKVDYFNSSHESGAITRKVLLLDPVGAPPGQIPPAHSGKFYFWFGQTSPASVEGSYIGIHDSDDTFEGSGGRSLLPVLGSLESRPLDLTGYSSGRMSFWTWWEIEGYKPATGYDVMQVFIAKGPSYNNWTSLGFLNPTSDPVITSSGEAYTSGGSHQPGIWVNHSFDLSPYIGGKIKIKFSFNTIDQFYNGFRGWFIDDIVVTNESFGVFSVNKLRQTIIRQPRN